jgi:hypothetical protein
MKLEIQLKFQKVILPHCHITPQSLPSTSFSFPYSLITLSFDATQTWQLKASLNKQRINIVYLFLKMAESNLIHLQ